MLQQEIHKDKRTAALAELLGVPRYAALGLRVALSQFAAEYVPDGEFDGVPLWLIARAAAWEGEPEIFVSALQTCGIMDNSLRLVEGKDLSFHAAVNQKPIVEFKAISSEPKTRQEVLALPPVKPSSAEIARRLQDEPEAAAFFIEAQRLIGIFGHPESASLVMTHDYYGLSWDILLVMLHAVREMDTEAGTKTAIKSYEEFAKKLYAAGISTAEEAERFFANYRDIPKLFRFLSTKWDLTNVRPTPAQKEKLERWTSWGFSEEMIDLAYQTALDKPAKKPFSFADKILGDWHENGILTPEAVAKSRAEWGQRLKYNKSQMPSQSVARKPIQTMYESKVPSFDLDTAKSRASRGYGTDPKAYKKRR